MPDESPHEQQHAAEGAAADAAGSAGKQQEGTGLLLPLARIKKMMKEADDVKTVATDASWAVARATEVFLQELAVRAHAVMAADSSRKGLEYRDVAAVVQEWAAVDFLRGAVPPKVKVSDVREQLQKQLDEVTPRCLNDD